MVGFILGTSQMLLYIIYKYIVKKKPAETTVKQHENTTDNETKGVEMKGVI